MLCMILRIQLFTPLTKITGKLYHRQRLVAETWTTRSPWSIKYLELMSGLYKEFLNFNYLAPIFDQHSPLQTVLTMSFKIQILKTVLIYLLVFQSRRSSLFLPLMHLKLILTMVFLASERHGLTFKVHWHGITMGILFRFRTAVSGLQNCKEFLRYYVVIILDSHGVTCRMVQLLGCVLPIPVEEEFSL